MHIQRPASTGPIVCGRWHPGNAEPQTLNHADLDARLSGGAWLFAPEPQPVSDGTGASHAGDASQATGSSGPSGPSGTTQTFNFRWFVPELLKHKTVWRDVLLASLALQIVTLATPLFTQAIIDKVVVHRTQSTLITIASRAWPSVTDQTGLTCMRTSASRCSPARPSPSWAPAARARARWPS